MSGPFSPPSHGSPSVSESSTSLKIPSRNNFPVGALSIIFGDFVEKSNSEIQQADLKKSGFTSSIKKVNTSYTLDLGTLRNNNSLNSLVEKLRDQGFKPKVKKYSVAQANTQYPALQRIIQAYDDIELSGCIFTKLDECYSLGEVLSAAVEYQLPVSYVTDGQKVPEDIKIAEAKSLVSAAAKLYKKYGLNHTSGNNAIKTA